MKISLNSPILQLNGKPFTDVKDLRTVCFSAVTVPHPGNDKLSIDKKMELYRLAQRITSTPDEIEFTAEEIVILKTNIAAVFLSVEVIGQSVDLLDPAVK